MNREQSSSKGTGAGASKNATTQARKISDPRKDTERGMTQAQIKTVRDIEHSIKGNKDESLYAVDKDGNITTMLQGKGAGVEIPDVRVLKDAIVTHNHPRAIGQTGFDAIGSSFSGADINTMIRGDALMMRAKTPTYTYSVRRPEGGWMTPQLRERMIFPDMATKVEIAKVSMSVYNKHLNRVTSDVFDHVAATGRDRYNPRTGRYDIPMRYQAIIYERAMRATAKELGWDYTRRKG